MSLTLATFLVGVSVGLTVAIPLGPMGILCIQRTMAFGLAAGLSIGLAAATVQVAYGIFAVLGFGATMTAVAGVGAVGLSLLSAAILFWFAYRVLRRKAQVTDPERSGPGQIARSFKDALVCGFANPLTPILFFAAFPAYATTESLSGGPLLVSGVFAGVIGWYLVLSGAVALFRDRMSVRALNLTNRASGLALAGLGALMVVSAFGISVR